MPFFTNDTLSPFSWSVDIIHVTNRRNSVISKHFYHTSTKQSPYIHLSVHSVSLCKMRFIASCDENECSTEWDGTCPCHEHDMYCSGFTSIDNTTTGQDCQPATCCVWLCTGPGDWLLVSLTGILIPILIVMGIAACWYAEQHIHIFYLLNYLPMPTQGGIDC